MVGHQEWLNSPYVSSGGGGGGGGQPWSGGADSAGGGPLGGGPYNGVRLLAVSTDEASEQRGAAELQVRRLLPVSCLPVCRPFSSGDRELLPVRGRLSCLVFNTSHSLTLIRLPVGRSLIHSDASVVSSLSARSVGR